MHQIWLLVLNLFQTQYDIVSYKRTKINLMQRRGYIQSHKELFEDFSPDIAQLIESYILNNKPKMSGKKGSCFTLWEDLLILYVVYLSTIKAKIGLITTMKLLKQQLNRPYSGVYMRFHSKLASLSVVDILEHIQKGLDFLFQKCLEDKKFCLIGTQEKQTEMFTIKKICDLVNYEEDSNSKYSVKLEPGCEQQEIQPKIEPNQDQILFNPSQKIAEVFKKNGFQEVFKRVRELRVHNPETILELWMKYDDGSFTE